MPKSSLIALTGGTGFVGKHIIPALLKAGYKVRVLARSPEKLADIDYGNLGHDSIGHDNLEILKGELGKDDAALVKGADIVLHMAGLIKARSLSQFMAINAVAAGQVAQAAQEAKVGRFVLLSSQTANVPKLSGYAASKHAGELAVTAAYHGPLAIIRAPAVFGPGDEATRPFFDFISKGKLPVAGGKGWAERRMAMVYVKDLCRVITKEAMTGAYDGKTMTPCSIPDLSWPDFAAYAGDALGITVKAMPIPAPVIIAIAGLTSVSSRLFGMGHLTLGKLREFRYEDWTSPDVIQNATPFVEALRITAASYEKK